MTPIRRSALRRISTKAPLLAAAALFAAGFIVWPGCGSIPLKSARTPVSTLTRTNFSFVKGTHPTRSDLASTIGEPDTYYADLRVACYKLNKVSRRRLVIIFFIPVGVEKDWPLTEMAMIHFDDQDRMQRCAIKVVNGDTNVLRDTAKKWMTKPAGGSKAH